MLLLTLKKELCLRKKATVLELAQVLKIKPEWVCDLLGHWIRKGKVHALGTVGCGDKCFKCPQSWLKQYEWEVAVPSSDS